MNSMTQPRFDLNALRRRAGDTVFARGQAYHRDGQVRILAIDPARVLARVSGTEDYRTEMTGRGKAFGGGCDCPAFDDWGFCKHMVAVALTANALGDAAEAGGAGVLPRLREHLKTQSVEALVEMIIGLAERDEALFRKLDMASAITQADEGVLEARLSQAIDAAAANDGYISYREAPDWAHELDALLDTVAELPTAGRAELALKLAERAIDRIQQALSDVDDSDGHGGALLSRCQDIHLAAAQAVRPDPIQFARALFVREIEAEYDTFHGAAWRYGEVLGEAGRAEYRRLAADAWANMPPRLGPSRARGSPDGDYHQLMVLLDGFAEEDGDIEARIALRAKDLSSPEAYLQLAAFCLSHGRADDALRHAQEGLWLFEDARTDGRLMMFTADLLLKSSRRDEGETLLRKAFEAEPTLQLYTKLQEAGGGAARDRAIDYLKARLTKPQPRQWGHPADLLIHILTQEKMFGQAWAIVRDHGASASTKLALAQASDTSHPREAIETYTDQVNHRVAAGGDPAYVEAARLIAQMGRLRGADEQGAYLAELKARHFRKRNFIKRLG